MQFSIVADTFVALQATTKRLEKAYIIAKLLRQTPAKEHEQLLLLLQGRVFPEYDERKIGISLKLMLKAIVKASGATQTAVETIFNKHGDIGITAQECTTAKTQNTLFAESLTVKHVFDTIKKLTTLEGNKSTGNKLTIIAGLLGQATPAEARVISSIIVEQLRIGVATGTLRDALVWSHFPALAQQTYEVDFGTKETVQVDTIDDVLQAEYTTTLIAQQEPLALLQQIIALVQRGIDVSSSLSQTAKTLAEQGLREVQHMRITLFRPFHVMLAQKTPSIDDALTAVGTPLYAEYKYDGFRVQVHKEKDTVRLFTRRLEEVTHQFPDAVAMIRQHITADTVVCDGEVVGINAEGKYLPFQSISQRIRRKYNIEELAEKFPIEVRLFDILVHEDTMLIDEPLEQRRKLLLSVIDEAKHFGPSTLREVTTAQQIEEFFDASMKSGNEGLMLKKKDSPYQPGSRVGFMLKYKQTMENLDLVIVKATRGEGKRSQWFTSFTVACKDENDDLMEIGKVSTGLKELDEQGMSFNQLSKLLEEHSVADDGKTMTVTPTIVIEVGYEEIQKSPSYTSGYALRFPRFVLLREDRGLEDISDIRYIEQLYQQQRGRG